MSVNARVKEMQKAEPYAMTLASIPLLEHSDHLTKDEFERRYNAMPMTIKAELIEGKVYNVIPGPLENSRRAC
jgi:hypothetical protein